MQLKSSQFGATTKSLAPLKTNATRVARNHTIVAGTPPPAWPGRVPVPETLPQRNGPKKFSLLGSTGSIGTQTLDIVAEHPDKFQITALAAGSNIELLAEQIRNHHPTLVSIRDASLVAPLKELIKDVSPQPEILVGDQGIIEVARHADADACVTGIVGCAGLQPTVAAIQAGKDICLANKETLIAGGPFVLPLAEKHGVKILPADSEHSAIFQCLQGLPEGGMRRIILTASGGAFRDLPVEKLKNVGVADALKHPNWSMGKKITIDSATLMNKGLEVIEAHYLFGASYDNIEIVIHPQSIIHSMIETADSSVLAQLGWPDMRLPILYTMSWPQRVLCSEQTWPRLDFVKMGDLTFRTPDHEKYPAMALAYAAGRAGGTMTGVLSAANEQAVEYFLEEKIGYLDIMKVVEAACDKHQNALVESPSLEEIVHYDQWARDHVKELVGYYDQTEFRDRVTNAIFEMNVWDPLRDHPKYETIKHLGQGTFGSVLHARNRQTGDEVAIKLIDLGEKFYQKYVEREIINHRQLVHPHIVGFKEIFVTSQQLGIVMEYVGGGNLQQWVERHGRLPEWQARCFFQQITLALHYIHKALGIGHRDIKLGNILLNDSYDVPILKLCDFGYSKNAWLGSIPKTRVGTAAYISPEVARSGSHSSGYDPEKADVWSSAVTLYCMIAGCYPFSTGKQEVHLKKIKELTDQDVAAALSRLDVSPGSISLMSRMLTVDPAKRLSLEGILQDAWFRQFLPDLSKFAVPRPHSIQSESEVLRLMAEAERVAQEMKRAQMQDEFAQEVVDDVLDGIMDEGIMGGEIAATLAAPGTSNGDTANTTAVHAA